MGKIKPVKKLYDLFDTERVVKLFQPYSAIDEVNIRKSSSAAANIANFVRKYKLLHILFWCWSSVSLFHQYKANHTDNSFIYFDVVIMKLFQICCVYFVVKWLMPKFLNKKKYFKFVSLVIVSILVCTLLTLLSQNIVTVIVIDRHITLAHMLILFLSHTIDLAIFTAIFFAIYSIQERYYAEKQSAILEKEKLVSELIFLKAQLNPHFLFNAINSVYVLIEEDKKLASQTLLKFSGLLRYQIYDCSNNWMPLERELEFLKDYTDLERMRTNENLKLSFEVSGETSNFEIAPFILTPFVENAFKHRASHKDKNYVNIMVTIEDSTLLFSVVNTYSELASKPQKEIGGIGLQNVHRRLELLYKGRHQISVETNDETYSVNLKIALHENAMHHSRR